VFSSAATAKADPPAIVVSGGETQEAFDYAGAVRDRVWVDSDFDSDADGVADKIAVDIIRPAATDDGLKAPVIMDASPYYSTLGRGNESQLKADDASGLLSKWPLFLDNYFVPRGYAIALVDMTGTNHSTGCPTVQDATDNNAAVDVIDWFKGRRTAHDKDGNLVPAPAWFNGKTGMIGKSYDGALAAAAAVTGVDGLTTIVGESGPYDYYDYTRSDGVIQRGGHYVSSLASTVTDANRRAYCKPVRDAIDANDADATGDFTTRSGTSATTSRTRRRSALRCS
jgi:X-Pro dipeptidyl-peptidase